MGDIINMVKKFSLFLSTIIFLSFFYFSYHKFVSEPNRDLIKDSCLSSLYSSGNFSKSYSLEYKTDFFSQGSSFSRRYLLNVDSKSKLAEVESSSGFYILDNLGGRYTYLSPDIYKAYENIFSMLNIKDAEYIYSTVSGLGDGDFPDPIMEDNRYLFEGKVVRLDSDSLMAFYEDELSSRRFNLKCRSGLPYSFNISQIDKVNNFKFVTTGIYGYSIKDVGKPSAHVVSEDAILSSKAADMVYGSRIFNGFLLEYNNFLQSIESNNFKKGDFSVNRVANFVSSHFKSKNTLVDIKLSSVKDKVLGVVHIGHSDFYFCTTFTKELSSLRYETKPSRC